MKSVLVVVRDQKANVYTQPYTAPSRGVAIRAWGDQLKNPENSKSDQVLHPEDFTLWLIGEYDDNTAKIEWQTPEQIATAGDF